MAIDYNAQAEARLSRMDELFRRAEAFQFEMAKLQEAYGITQTEEFSQMPVDDQQNIIDDVMNSYEASQTSVQETQEAYEDINIDDHINTDLYKEALDEVIAEHYDENKEFYDGLKQFYEENNT